MVDVARPGKLTFLHVTDCHLSPTAAGDAVDRKVWVPGMPAPLREEVLRATLKRLVEALKKRGQKLDGVLFSGDGTLRGEPEGQKRLRTLLLEELDQLSVSNATFVASPGNHDIIAGTKPGTQERYKLFTDAWLEPSPVIVPFLDGIDDIDALDPKRHVLTGDDGAWAVFPINTANWCQLTLRNEEYPGLDRLRDIVKDNDELRKLLDKLSSYDIARVSEDQLEVLRHLITSIGDEATLRIAVMHHHTLPVGAREEFKPFADMTNLGQLRQVLREHGFQILIHGHKHETAAYFDHIYADDDLTAPAHRILTISGGTFDAASPQISDPVRLIEIEHARHAPICTITRVAMASPGRRIRLTPLTPIRVWETDAQHHGPIVIYGTSIDDVYERAVQATDVKRTMICVLDLNPVEELPIPKAYPHAEDADRRREWFEETVRWWQLPSSRLEDRIPYIHGSRLKRFAGWFNQIERIIGILKDGKATSKTIALIVDPTRDLAGNNSFASFCFVQFCLRGNKTLDCIGYYRTQEFRHWWPVNVAELRHLQIAVANAASLAPGQITTIAPYPRLSEVRQPTKVAVPLIDQWLDNHPERIALITMALTNGQGEHYEEGLKYWRRCINDLLQGATEFHADGVPVAIEGLDLLRDWMKCAGGDEDLLRLLDELSNENRMLPNNPKLHEFNRWKTRVTPRLRSLLEYPRPTVGSHA